MSIEELKLMLSDVFELDMWFPEYSIRNQEFERSSYSVWALQELTEYIMSDPEQGDRTRIWFWTMISNLELDDMIDSKFNADYVGNAVQRLLNREYERDGKGGLFRIKHCKYNLRNVEIWYQANWYLNGVK